MAIVINLDVVMAKRKVGLTELAKDVDITLANLSILKNNKAKAVRLSTLDAICKALDCQPGDIIQRVNDKELEELIVERAQNAVRQMRDSGGNEASLPTSVFAADLSDE